MKQTVTEWLLEERGYLTAGDLSEKLAWTDEVLL